MGTDLANSGLIQLPVLPKSRAQLPTTGGITTHSTAARISELLLLGLLVLVVCRARLIRALGGFLNRNFGCLNMNLVIFDIDGTLTETDHVDDICFVQALADAHSITEVSTDWAGYPHTTDSAIMFHIFQEKFNRTPDDAELLKFKSCFVSLMQGYLGKDSSLFTEIGGASLMLWRLNQEPEWRVAIASGGWRVSATFKLKVAGIEVDDFPSAFADDGFSREEILQSAVSRAQVLYQQSHFDRIVSVGDGLWDARTARNLKFPFLGIGHGEGEIKLRRAGATHVIADFTDYRQVLRCLAEADVPKAESVV